MKNRVNPVLIAVTVFVIISLSCSFSYSSGGDTSAPAAAPNNPVAPQTAPSSQPVAPAAPQPTETQVPPTATSDPVIDQKYADMEALLNKLAADGYLSSTTGIGYPLNDFTESWAQIGYYQWYPFELEPVNLVATTDITWELASSTPDPSGCGLVFHLGEDNSNYFVFLSVDGYVYSYAVKDGGLVDMGRAYYGKVGNSGTAKLGLVVVGNTYRVFVNDTLVKTYTGFASAVLDGQFAFAIASGTNKEFGTRCIFSNAMLWELTP